MTMPMTGSRACRPVLAIIALAIGIACANKPGVAPTPARDTLVQIGYGTSPRAAVAEAIATITRGQIESCGCVSIQDLLERVPGVHVTRGGDVSLRIRFATGDPLVVIDGTPMATEGVRVLLIKLAPADIERIDVLKDGTTSAIYGERGSNGVILVRTRRR